MAWDESKSTASTLLGLLSILFWSTSFAFSRSLQEQVGPITGAAGIYLLAGVLGCLAARLREGRLPSPGRLPVRYALICGGLFITYIVTVQLGIGWSRNRQQAVEVIVINYLWPGLTMALAVPLLGRRARWFLLPGVVLGFAGIALAMTSRGFSLPALWENLRASPLPYGLGLAAAVAWAGYSNLSRRLARDADVSGVPLFLLASGAVLAATRLLVVEQAHWTPRAAAELLYTAVFPGLLAYTFWEAAMRRGRITFVVAASYLTPLLSVIVSCAYLGVPMTRTLWLACAMVIAGAAISKWAIVETPAPGTAADSGGVSQKAD